MANPTIATIKCPMGDGCTGEVRRYSRGRRLLYWVCDHGMMTPNLPAGQKFIADRMEEIQGQPEASEDPTPDPLVKPDSYQHEKPARKRSWLSTLLEDDDE